MKRTKQATLHIGKPRVEKFGDKMRVVASVTHEAIPGINGTGGDMWFAVSEPHGQYLCYERSDAFVVGMLFYCMRLGLDIECEAPVSEEILFNLRTYFVPSISRNCAEMYACNILAEPAMDPLANAGAVGTGISCGVDSLHALYQQTNSPCKGMNVTHLVLNNAGAYKEGSSQYSWQLNHGREFAREYGYEFVETDSNYHELFPLNHKWLHWTNTYANAFCALCLQKLWGKFTIASAGDSFAIFTLSKILEYDSATYDLLFLNVISTRWMRFYSGGGAETRYYKTLAIAEYEPAKKYLHVCTDDSGPNCNVCAKCIRTMVTLDAIGKLDEFDKVFDVNYYRANRKFYLKAVYWAYFTQGTGALLDETYNALKKDYSLGMKAAVWYAAFRKRLSSMKLLASIYHSITPRMKSGDSARKENFGALPLRDK